MRLEDVPGEGEGSAAVVPPLCRLLLLVAFPGSPNAAASASGISSTSFLAACLLLCRVLLREGQGEVVVVHDVVAGPELLEQLGPRPARLGRVSLESGLLGFPALFRQEVHLQISGELLTTFALALSSLIAACTQASRVCRTMPVVWWMRRSALAFRTASSWTEGSRPAFSQTSFWTSVGKSRVTASFCSISLRHRPLRPPLAARLSPRRPLVRRGAKQPGCP